MCRSLAILFLSAVLAFSAPAPPLKTSPGKLTEEALYGDWVMRWGGYPYRITLSRSGIYTCHWSGKTYLGFWRVLREGKLEFVESATPTEATSYQRFVIDLNYKSFEGVVVSGSAGIKVQLIKPSNFTENLGQ